MNFIAWLDTFSLLLLDRCRFVFEVEQLSSFFLLSLRCLPTNADAVTPVATATLSSLWGDARTRGSILILRRDDIIHHPPSHTNFFSHQHHDARKKRTKKNLLLQPIAASSVGHHHDGQPCLHHISSIEYLAAHSIYNTSCRYDASSCGKRAWSG